MFRRMTDRLSNRFPRFKRFLEWRRRHRKKLIAAFVVTMHTLGAISSIQAIMSTRTPQGAIAWAVSLNTFPYVAVPAYWVFGQSRFDGYEFVRQKEMLAKSATENRVIQALREQEMMAEPRSEREEAQLRLLESLSLLPLTRYNDVDLLIDGQATFDAIIEAIESAEEYVLFQFYIIRDDELGNRIQEALLAKAVEGVRVYVQYDALGSLDLPPSYVEELRDGGVEVSAFKTAGGWGNPFRINFRNHRKIVVIDGREAFVGGHNVGDEYLGKHPELTPWRDTHVALRGPVVLATQVSFVEDWLWATGEEIHELHWTPERAPQGDVAAMCFPTGPADELETGTLLMLDAINVARKRIWIATPYFVPDEQFVSALQLASLRGVEVKVLIPENNDDRLVDLTSYSYLEEGDAAGIEFYRYQPGFMHQKVVLVDDEISMVGTANFDNRSMRLNFEVTMLIVNADFAREVETMLQADFEKSLPVTPKAYTESSAPFRFMVRTARLLAPVQ